MSPIERIERAIQEALPTSWTRLRQPRNPNGTWWLDIKHDDQVVTIEWSRRHGFGVTASMLSDGFGEGPEETFDSADRATARVLHLLATKSHTIPPREVVLRELRALAGVTQQELAEKLGVQQAAISRLERRPDITLSSLRRFVSALDATLEIYVRTPTGEQIRLSDAPTERVKEKHVACVHVDGPASSPNESIPTLANDQCMGWLSTFEDLARSRWGLTTPTLQLQTAFGATLASCDPSKGRISLDHKRAWRICSDLFSATHSSLQPISREHVFHRTVQHTLAHEVGHFVPMPLFVAEPAFRDFAHEELKSDAVAGWIAGRLGQDALVGSLLSDKLGCRTSACTHPAPKNRTLAFLAGHGRGSTERAELPTMSLLVIRAKCLESAKAFYTALGLSLRPEKHGRGPRHYSCRVSGTTMELYPSKSEHHVGGLRVGLRVSDPADAIRSLRQTGLLHKEPRVLDRGTGTKVWVVDDPDGNTVELEQIAHSVRSPFV